MHAVDRLHGGVAALQQEPRALPVAQQRHLLVVQLDAVAQAVDHHEPQPLQVLAARRLDPATDPDRGGVAGIPALESAQEKRRVGDVAGEWAALIEG